MTVVSLNSIVNNILLKRKYPIHYYLEFLVNAKDCLREISFDDVQTLRYKVLQLNDNHAIEIPSDYVDYTRVSVMIGQHLQPLVEDSRLNLVPNYDSSFEIQPYSEGVATDTDTVSYAGYYAPYWWMVNYNAFGENTGRQFGGIGAFADTFSVNKPRNEIKINESLDITQVVLEYIGNGLDADSATHIDAYAQATIEAYCMWMFKENNRTYSAGEANVAKQEYINQRQILRARLSDLSIDKMRRIVQRNAIAIKY